MFSIDTKSFISYALMGGGGVGYINSAINAGGASAWLNKVEVPYSFGSSEKYKGKTDGKVTGREGVENAARFAMRDSARGKGGRGGGRGEGGGGGGGGGGGVGEERRKGNEIEKE